MRRAWRVACLRAAVGARRGLAEKAARAHVALGGRRAAGAQQTHVGADRQAALAAEALEPLVEQAERLQTHVQHERGLRAFGERARQCRLRRLLLLLLARLLRLSNWRIVTGSRRRCCRWRRGRRRWRPARGSGACCGT